MSKKDSKGQDETISVHLRLKPTKRDSGFLTVDPVDESIVRMTVPERGVSRADGYVNNSKTQYSFMFNSVIPIEAKQNEVFDIVGRDAVTNVLNGINSTIFAYGQTGSGKTFTITGGVDSYEQRGIIPRAISMIFQHFAAHKDVAYSCHISYLEIYNESGFDLLDPSHETKSLEQLPRVTMMTDDDGNCHLKNLSTHRANTEEEALNLLFMGDTNRAIAETPMNLASSRSHCLFTLFVEGRKQGADTVRRAKLHLVDLAGSERAHKTGATGQTLREATYINQSLFYLEMVIVALHEKATKARAHIPYRNSMMTSVLRDSLGGNCKTVMVATVSVEAEQAEESISTCKFAQRVALIKNDAVVNEDLDPTLLISRLKGELGAMREEVAFLKGEAGEGAALSPEEVAKLHAAIQAYVASTDPYATLQMGKMTLTKLKDAFALFKNLIIEARKWSNQSSGKDPTLFGGNDTGDGGGAKGDGAKGNGADGSSSDSEVAELREKLRQRDQEIAILVNMVKQARGNGALPPDGGGGGQPQGHAAKGSDHGTVGEFRRSQQQHQQQLGSGLHAPAVGEAKEAAAAAVPAPTRKPATIPVVGGVKLCADPALLGDAEKAFEYFRSQWPRTPAVEDNKRILKEKYDSAKELYEKVVAARSTISYLKKTIEALRREQAMEREGLTEGEGGAAEAEEQQHIVAMEREKALYTQACNNLRDDKAAIEHIQKLLEQGRAKLQQDFDEWYGKCMHAEARHALQGAPTSAASAALAPATPAFAPAAPATAPAPTPASVSASSAAAPRAAHWAGEGLGGGGAGIALTGNKEADDDIVAFQRARDELYALQRRQQQMR